MGVGLQVWYRGRCSWLIRNWDRSGGHNQSSKNKKCWENLPSWVLNCNWTCCGKIFSFLEKQKCSQSVEPENYKVTSTTNNNNKSLFLQLIVFLLVGQMIPKTRKSVKAKDLLIKTIISICGHLSFMYKSNKLLSYIKAWKIFSLWPLWK